MNSFYFLLFFLCVCFFAFFVLLNHHLFFPTRCFHLNSHLRLFPSRSQMWGQGKSKHFLNWREKKRKLRKLCFVFFNSEHGVCFPSVSRLWSQPSSFPGSSATSAAGPGHTGKLGSKTTTFFLGYKMCSKYSPWIWALDLNIKCEEN